MKELLIAILIFPIHTTLWSQNLDWEIHLMQVDSLENNLSGLSLPESQSGDSVMILNEINNLISNLRLRGYILANLDSVEFDHENRIIDAWIYAGNQFQWGNINFKSVSSDPPYDLKRFDLSKLTNKEISIHKIETSIRDVIEYHENRGYPFASISWDSVRISGSRISAVLQMDPGPHIVYDTVVVSGELKIKPGFLSSYIDTPPGKSYSKRSVENIPERLESLEYLKISRNPNITFQNEEARILLPVEKVPANRFDAIIGFLPNQNSDQGLLITGFLDLSLKNLFQSGKQIEFHWDRIQKLTQTLNLDYYHPNLFRSPLGLTVNFFLYKQDTTFLNRKMGLGFDYKTGRYGNIFFNTRWESSRLISTAQYSNAATLPEIADYNMSALGVVFTNIPVRGLSYRSKRRWGFTSEVNAGNKVIRQNSEFDQGLYEDVDLSSIQFSGRFLIEGIQNFQTKPFSIFGKLSGGLIKNERLFLNDLYRLGGLNSIRGFNENTFYASQFLMASIELHTYFNDISSIFLFFDQAHLSYDLGNSKFSDNPFGTGLGLNLESAKGIFSFVYAFGKSTDQPLSIRYSKIHFGFKAFF